MTRKTTLAVVLCSALGYGAYDWSQKNVEVVTLHASGGYSDYYPRLFIVDDPPSAWVRAERPDRMWLASVRENPEVVVRRGDVDVAYHAVVWNGEGDHEHVDALFRAKYGSIDLAAAWFWRRDDVPIRLEPRY